MDSRYGAEAVFRKFTRMGDFQGRAESSKSGLAGYGGVAIFWKQIATELLQLSTSPIIHFLTNGSLKMGSFSIWHWIILLFITGIFVVPLWRIISKAGYSGAWSLLCFVPFLNLIMLWVFAFAKWPNSSNDA
jgi:hypothetical protein